MIDRIGDLVRRQADVYRLQDGPHHRDGKIGLQEPVAVPVEDADGVAGADTEPAEAGSEPPDALAQATIGETLQVAVYDLLIGRHQERRGPQLLDEQGILISGLCGLHWGAHAACSTALLRSSNSPRRTSSRSAAKSSIEREPTSA